MKSLRHVHAPLITTLESLATPDGTQQHKYGLTSARDDALANPAHGRNKAAVVTLMKQQGIL